MRSSLAPFVPPLAALYPQSEWKWKESMEWSQMYGHFQTIQRIRNILKMRVSEKPTGEMTSLQGLKRWIEIFLAKPEWKEHFNRGKLNKDLKTWKYVACPQNLQTWRVKALGNISLSVIISITISGGYLFKVSASWTTTQTQSIRIYEVETSNLNFRSAPDPS